MNCLAHPTPARDDNKSRDRKSKDHGDQGLIQQGKRSAGYTILLLCILAVYRIS